MADTSQNLLIESIKNNDTAQAKILLERGADPNHVNKEEGVSPMHLAAGIGVEPLCLLLQYCGDPNIRLDDGTTPVHIAAIWGFADCIQILLANGGNPFLRDQDGLSAEDLAVKYQHDDVLQVLRHYMYILSADEEHTMTPMFTYKRLSIESTSSESPSDIQCNRNCSNSSTASSVDNSLYNAHRLENYLQEFTRRRRSSVYLRDVERQFDKYFKHGQKTHLFDVTSPDHPYVERRDLDVNISPACSNSPGYSPSDNSCDSFVTCDGGESYTLEDSVNSENCFNNDRSSPHSSNISNTVVKNPKYVNCESDTDTETTYQCKRLFPESCHAIVNERGNQTGKDHVTKNVSKNSKNLKRSGECRKNKYCIRQSLDVSNEEKFSGEKCEFCGGPAEKQIQDGLVCASCEKLGLELDELVSASGANVLHSGDTVYHEKSGYLPDLLETLPDTAMKSSRNVVKNSCLLAERCREFIVDRISDSQNKEPSSDTVCNSVSDVDEDVKDEVKTSGKISNNRLPRLVKSDEISDLTEKLRRSSLDQFSQRFKGTGITERLGTRHSGVSRLNDSMVSHISSTVNELDKARVFDDSLLTLDETFLNRTDLLDRKDSVDTLLQGRDFCSNSETNIRYRNGERNNVVDRKKSDDEDYLACPQEHNDLWKEIQACKCEKLDKKRTNVLDTAFCGRQSMSSIYSDASTVDYVYTDKENGITLVERHLPSLCGSQGSRRSIDSQFSANTETAANADSGYNKKSTRCSTTSEDTVLYNWRDDAMLQSDDSGNGLSIATGSAPLSQDLLDLDNETLRRKLSGYGDDPGPVTKTTRQTYLRRLSQLQNDPDSRLITTKSPEYPPELRQAMNGQLDLSDMPALETKMVAAFQNPDRLRRWREGTLKSSFNYILLDPRITRNLPNRAVNMSDQAVFQTFISATFYIGKGKRARPYCHLYEAIKHQQKKTNKKMGKKVEKILEIWNCGMGVVSLHCYQSVIPVEAYTREACMIDAIGLNLLTNQKKGDYYGMSATFSMKERRKMGVYLLKKALQIFLAEGERQIAPLDIKKD